PISEVIVEGIRRASSVRRFIDRMGSGHGVLEQSEAPLAPGLFTAEEIALRGLVDGRLTVQILSQKGPGSVAENARLLYAFFCLDLLRVKEPASVKKLQWKTEGGSLGD
ncbi:MAG TPA: hypothetical protein VK392_05385, partial [Thermoanaerobaculia bacterium]|nr:hypothetical protein [Thermoanaerobaculia bacterium]